MLTWDVPPRHEPNARAQISGESSILMFLSSDIFTITGIWEEKDSITLLRILAVGYFDFILSVRSTYFLMHKLPSEMPGKMNQIYTIDFFNNLNKTDFA